MEANDRRRRPLGVDLSLLGDDPLAEIAVFVGATDITELDRRMRAEVTTEVAKMLEAIGDADAFDVIELLRMRALPVSPELALEPGFDGSAAAIELVALVLLARGERQPGGTPRAETRPHEQTEELHERAKRLLRLASYRSFSTAQLGSESVLAHLAAEYQSYFVGVRSHQYRSVQDAHDAALFDRPDANGLLESQLGFTYRAFLAVREAILTSYSTQLNDILDRMADALPRTGGDESELSAGEQASLRDDAISFIFLPGQRATFTSQDLAELCDIHVDEIRAVLDLFSTEFTVTDPVDAVMAFLGGTNALGLTGLVRAGDERVMISSPIGDDSFRASAESALKADPKVWRRYDQKIRSKVTELRAADAIETLLGLPPAAAPLFYVAPKKGKDPKTVDERCPNPLASGDLTESDALFVIDDVAICVEVKARSVADSARRGDLKRFEQEAKTILGAGAGQARRLESLIRTNGGVWRKDGSWFDLSMVREIHTIVVGLDTFGPLAVSLGELAAAAVLGEGHVPWITSLHDLEVIAAVLDRPSEFLLYLRRRTGPGIAENYSGCDELDLFMLFVDGGLYVDPDPDEVHREHKRTPSPSRVDRQRHRDAARPTIVGTHTDDLDAWMYSVEGRSHAEAPKPRFNTHRSADELVDLLQEGQVPGWLRFGSDLLALSGEAQAQVGSAIGQICCRTRTDGQLHTIVMPYAGNQGFPVFFAASTPPDLDVEVAMDQLETYMRAKKHQLQADRAMGMVFDHERTAIGGVYMNNRPSADAELDELARRVGLRQTWKMRPRPKSANKARRQRKKAKKRKRR